MMIYLHTAHSEQFRACEQVDFKSLLKNKSIDKQKKNNFRRSDRFTQLALLGAVEFQQKLTSKNNKLSPSCALYLTSGQGNLAVFNRVRDNRLIDRILPKPFDFINFLSNTASFYIAQFLDLCGKNIFLSQQNFPTASALIMAESELQTCQSHEVIVAGIDEVIEPLALSKKYLNFKHESQLTESFTYLHLKSTRENALLSINTQTKIFSQTQLETYIQVLNSEHAICFTGEAPQASYTKNLVRLDDFESSFSLQEVTKVKAHKNNSPMFETKAMAIISYFLNSGYKQLSLFESKTDYKNGEYMLMELTII